MSDGAWITLVAGLVATGCALLGSFLVVRRQSLLTDAISHAVLPGIVLAWLVTGTRNPVAMVIGAGIFAIACVLVVELLEQTGLVRSDSAIALTFPVLFSLGVLGVARWTEDIHLDLDATIYGEVAFVVFDRVELLGLDPPRAAVVAAAVVAIDLIVIVAGWRVLRAASFDPGFAASVGVPVRLVSRSLLVVTAMTAVVAFEAVGAILVITLFIVPAATGVVLARRMHSVVLVAVAVGWACAVAGWQSAIRWDTSVAGTMGVVAGLSFALAILLRAVRGRLGARRARGRGQAGGASESMKVSTSRDISPNVPGSNASR
jgi:manganese/zinc/iron transport system permease protein